MNESGVAMAQSSEEKNRRYFLDFAALLLTPLLIVVQGHDLGLGNHDTILSFMRRIQDPAYLAGDWMLSTSPVHPLLTGAMAYTSNFIGEIAVLLFLQLITRFFLLAGVWRLCEALLPGRILLPILMMGGTIFEPRFHLGFHFLQGAHWEPAFLGMAFAVWILATAIDCSLGKTKWVLFGILGGAGTLAHLFVALPVFTICLIAAIIQTKEWKKSSLAFIIALLIGAPAWIPAALGFFFPGETPLSSEQVISFLQFRHPHHHQPWVWPISHYLLAAIFLTAVAYAWQKLLKGEDRKRLWVPEVLFCYFIVSCFLFTVLGYAHKMPFIAYLQPFRILSLFILLAMIVVVETTLRPIQSRSFFEKLVTVSVMLAVVRTISFFGPFFISLNLFFTRNIYREYKGEKFNLSNETKPVLIYLLLSGFAASISIVAFQTNSRLPEFINKFHREHWISRIEPETIARQQLVDWIQTNTSDDDLFAIPPQMGYFRIWEKRPIIVDWKNPPYENKEIAEWSQRISDLTGENPFDQFSTISEEDPPLSRLQFAAKKYGADYIVLRKSSDDALTVFSNDQYSVLLAK